MLGEMREEEASCLQVMYQGAGGGGSILPMVTEVMGATFAVSGGVGLPGGSYGGGGGGGCGNAVLAGNGAPGVLEITFFYM